MNKIAIASDHAGFELKQILINNLNAGAFGVEDFGPHNSDSVDYPDYGFKVAQWVVKKELERGIIICGTGIGMSIVVNRFPGIRGTLCGDVFTARLSREHNDSNILILGGHVVGAGLAMEIVNTWMNTTFEGGRHKRRLNKIELIDDMIQKGEI